MSSTNQAVYATVSLADVLGMPVELERAHRFLIQSSRTLLETSMAVDSLVSQKLVARRDELVYLAGRDGVLDTYLERTARAAAMWKPAISWCEHIGRVPFVRMVAVIGGLAAGNMAEHDAIEFAIVVRPRRLWLTRRMITVVTRRAARRGIILRPKFIATSRALELSDRSVYLAYEFAQMKVVIGKEVCRTLRRSNMWIFEFVPNATIEGDERRVSDHAPSRTQKWIEWLLLLPPFRLVESWERRRSIAKLSRTASRSLGAARPDASRYSAEVCKGELLDDAATIDAAWQKRLQST